MTPEKLEQIEKYVSEDLPISSAVARDWLKLLLEENKALKEQISALWGMV